MKLASLKRFFYNPLILVLLGAIVAPIANDLWTKVPIATTFVFLFNLLIKWSIFILTFQLQVWYLLVTGLLILGGIRLKRYLGDRKYVPTDEDGLTDADWDRIHEQMDAEEYKQYQKKKDTLAYKNDKFLNYTWEWEWIKNPKLFIYEPKKIAPCCPDPDCQLRKMWFHSQYGLKGFKYFCDNCGNSRIIRANDVGDIEHEIEGYIQKKTDTL